MLVLEFGEPAEIHVEVFGFEWPTQDKMSAGYTLGAGELCHLCAGEAPSDNGEGGGLAVLHFVEKVGWQDGA